MDEPVAVANVANEIEADLVCGLLRSAGIECGFRPIAGTDTSFAGAVAGRVEVVVAVTDEDAARQLLAAGEAS